MAHFVHNAKIMNPMTGSAQTLGRNAQGTTVVDSMYVDIRYIKTVGFEVSGGNGDYVGFLEIQGSNSSGSWSRITGAGVSMSGSTADVNQVGILNLDGVGFALARARYTNASGSGSISVTVQAKGV